MMKPTDEAGVKRQGSTAAGPIQANRAAFHGEHVLRGGDSADTDRERDRQAGGQADRQEDRQTVKHTQC